MELTERQIAIFHGRVCPYCGRDTKHMDSAAIYGKSYGMVYACLPCDAWVGVHQGEPTKALGRVAKEELRRLKNKAHAAFDPIWENRLLSRRKAYAWLSEQLGTPIKFTHIGMFSEATCRKVVELCAEHFETEKD